MLQRLIIAILVSAAGVLASADGAAPSHAAPSAAGTTSSQTLLTLACPSVSVCYAGGEHGTVIATHDGGATWQSQSWRGVTAIVGIACPTVTNCFAQAQAGCDELGAHVPFFHTTDGGAQWIMTSIDGCGSSLTCPTTTTCGTIISPTGPGAPAFVRTTDSGRTWQVQARLDPNSLTGIVDCPSSTACSLAFQNALGHSGDGGRHWSIARTTGRICGPQQTGCPSLLALACPGQLTCYAAGSEFQNGRLSAVVLVTKDGFRSRTSHLVPGLFGITALSCPTRDTCLALGGTGVADRLAVTTDAGVHWRLKSITAPYPFTALACASVKVCTAAGYLGRLVGTRDRGATWHDLLPALFVSGTYGAGQPLHTLSPWFTATAPWHLAVGKVSGFTQANGRPLATECGGIDTVTVTVRNAQGQAVAGPVRAPGREDRVARKTLQVTGRLRLDAVSRCSTFSLRVDGVQPARS